ncbi:MAG: hypothetical protein WBH31_12070 [Promethearchaeia archaeon]
MKIQKSNFLGFRLPEDVLEKLELIAKQKATTRGIAAKNGIEQWINRELYNQTNQMITIPKKLLINLLSIKDSKEKFNKIIKESADIITDIMKFIISKPMNEETFEEYLKFSILFFGSNELNWFNTFDININENNFNLIGLHDLDENFSNFFQVFYKHLLREYFNFNIIINLEETTSNLIHLDLNFRKINENLDVKNEK